MEKTQSLCRAYAAEQIERQKKDFQRLGVLGDWDHPFTTMAYKNEADEIRTLAKLLAKGYLYRGLKPVNWCFDCGSALADADDQYAEREDPPDGLGVTPDANEKLAKALGLPRHPFVRGYRLLPARPPHVHARNHG